MLICHKNQPTNQPTRKDYSPILVFSSYQYITQKASHIEPSEETRNDTHKNDPINGSNRTVRFFSKVLILLSLLLLVFYSFESFSHQRLLTVFHCNVSDSKSSQVSTTLFSILSDLKNVVVWMVSTHPLISNSSCPRINPLLTVPRAPITNCVTFIFMFHRFFNSLASSTYLSLFSLSFCFTSSLAGRPKCTIRQVFILLFIITRSVRVVEIRLFSFDFFFLLLLIFLISHTWIY